MKIKSMSINGIGGITNLLVDFDKNMNIICGPNGIGKTTILECVAHTFSASSTNILKRNALSSSGKFQSIVEVDGKDHSISIDISHFDPGTASDISGLHPYSKYLLSLKAARTFQYQPLDSVSKDVKKEGHHTYEEAKHGGNLSEVKNWFVNRYLYSAHPDALTGFQIHNLELAKKCFSLLNPDFSFSKVLASSNEIMVNTPNGEIYYEYLSSGFKSCLSILFGIIKDIELRFVSPGINADSFDGIILIDEVELHLHPEWQGKIIGILRGVFSEAQFITSTHSPHVIQAANPDEIIAISNDSGKISRRDLSAGEFGYQGWTVEEILVDVMGMTDTRTAIYHAAISAYEKAIATENYDVAQEHFQTLTKLLHHNNPLRKLLSLDLSVIRGIRND